jgi:hypothetical protein
MTAKESRFILAKAANAAERIAAMLERWASVDPLEARAVQLEIAASDLAHHADAIREASGITADTEANLAAIISNPSTR